MDEFPHLTDVRPGVPVGGNTVSEPSIAPCGVPIGQQLCILRPGHIGSHTFEQPAHDFEVRRAVLEDIADERRKQERKNPGTTCASPDLSETERLALLVAEVGEVSEEVKMLRWPWTREARTGQALTDSQVRARLRKELLQVSAICMAWMEHVDDEEAREGLA